MSCRATIVGAGPTGVTLAWLVAQAGHDVRILTGRSNTARKLRTDRSLPGVTIELPDTVDITTGAKTAFSCEVVILAVPPRAARARLRDMASLVRPEHRILHAAKGLDDSGTSVSTAITEETCCIRTGVIGGPLVLDELWRGEDTAALVASRFQSVVDEATALLTSPHVRVYGSLDLVGTELAGALRTPVALAAGMLHGVGFGRSSASVLMTRAVVEGSRLAQALGGRAESLSGLSGIGDWMVVATTPEDDVVQAGIRLARGESVDHEEAESRALALAGLAERHGVDMPIVLAVARILRGEPFAEVLAELMSRAARPEWDGVR